MLFGISKILCYVKQKDRKKIQKLLMFQSSFMTLTLLVAAIGVFLVHVFLVVYKWSIQTISALDKGNALLITTRALNVQ